MLFSQNHLPGLFPWKRERDFPGREGEAIESEQLLVGHGKECVLSRSDPQIS